MPYSMFQASVPAFLQSMNALVAILDKAAAFAQEKRIDPAELINARLAPDMFPLSRQVQIVSDNAKGAVARLAGRDIPKYEDTESTFDDLKARLAKTIAFIKSVPEAEFEGSDAREVSLTVGGKAWTVPGQRFLVHQALPNFYFHAATAYDILRHCGVEIGKRDFIGTI